MTGAWVGALLVASPVMIRDGYSTCTACHDSPQGGGLLTEYGRGVDEAQSMRSGEYLPQDLPFDQDVRFQTRAMVGEGGAQGRAWIRGTYRMDQSQSLAWMVYGATPGADARAGAAYDRSPTPDTVNLFQAVYRMRPKDGAEVDFGRDRIPVGVLVPDPTIFVRSRNRESPYDLPTQAKLFLWTRHLFAVPFAFGPSGEESSPAEKETGAGLLAEVSLAGDHLVLGGRALEASSLALERQLVAAHLRLGMGDSWGLLAEHDFTHRTLFGASPASFDQNASFAELFVAPREWVVLGLTGERLSVAQPFADQQYRMGGDLTLRFSSNATVRFFANRGYLADGAITYAQGFELTVKIPNSLRRSVRIRVVEPGLEARTSQPSPAPLAPMAQVVRAEPAVAGASTVLVAEPVSVAQPAPVQPAGVAPPAVPAVDLKTCQGQRNEQPLGVRDTFALARRQVYAWVEVKGEAPGDLTLTWYKGATKIDDRPLPVTGSPWHGLAKKTLRDEQAVGEWRVEITDPAGRVLATRSFRVEN